MFSYFSHDAANIFGEEDRISTVPAKDIDDEGVAEDTGEANTGDDNAGDIMPFCRDEGEMAPVGMDEVVVGVVDMGRSVGGVRRDGGEG